MRGRFILGLLVVGLGKEPVDESAEVMVGAVGDGGSNEHSESSPDEDTGPGIGRPLLGSEGEDERGVGEDEEAAHEAGARRHAGEEGEGEAHGGGEADPASPHEEPVQPAPLRPHDGLAGEVARAVVLPVAAGHVGADLVGQRGDERRYHQEDAAVVLAQREQAAAATAASCTSTAGARGRRDDDVAGEVLWLGRHREDDAGVVAVLGRPRRHCRRSIDGYSTRSIDHQQQLIRSSCEECRDVEGLVLCIYIYYVRSCDRRVDLGLARDSALTLDSHATARGYWFHRVVLSCMRETSLRWEATKLDHAKRFKSGWFVVCVLSSRPLG